MDWRPLPWQAVAMARTVLLMLACVLLVVSTVLLFVGSFGQLWLAWLLRLSPGSRLRGPGTECLRRRASVGARHAARPARGELVARCAKEPRNCRRNATVFESTLILLQEYTNWAFRSGESFSQHHVNELRERLGQLEYLCARISEREVILARDGLGDPEKGIDNLMQLRLYTEAFYYFAFRVFSFIRKGSLLGLRPFNCPGVLGVRNHLIEHPEGALGVLEQSLGFDPARGLLLKLDGRPGGSTKFQDAGFHHNRDEFKNALDRCLSSAVRTG